MLHESLEAYLKEVRIDWVKDWPGQTVLAVTCFYWTVYVTEAITKGNDAMWAYKKLNDDQITDIVALVSQSLNHVLQKKKKKLVNCKYKKKMKKKIYKEINMSWLIFHSVALVLTLQVRGKLSKQNRVTLQALIVLDVHARDVLQQLCEMGISDPNDFNWLSQLRYYWEVSSNCQYVN